MVELKLMAEAIKREKAQKMTGALEYVRFREGFRKIERGTVICSGRVIWGFPHIKRIFTLEKGLDKNISAGVIYAEEKIDGFNVRIASINKKIFAFSRGGFLDLFVSEKAREMKLEKFFRDYPDHVLCGEMIGNTPYTEPTKEFDVRLFVFDIDEGDGSYVSMEQKYSLLKKYGIPGVPQLGKFKSSDHKALGKLVLSLNKGRKEGMVLKSADRKEVLKYVTPWSDIDDIAKSSKMFFDMPIGFYYQRVLRSAFFIRDFGLDRGEYEKMLGRAFYEGLIGALEDAAQGRQIDEEFEILIRNPEIWSDMKRHMGREVRLEELWRREEGGRIRMRFRKIFKRTSRTLISYAAGKGITD
jgi:putative ATP-dependent DNA ligase